MSKNPVKEYNSLMVRLCREHNTIGTRFSEDTDGWNLRDMVSEVQYTLDVYEDEGSIYWEDAHDESQPSHKPWYKDWLKEKEEMKKFIKKYKDEAMKMQCTIGHCSIYD